jgi:two-component system NtrC family sensor kinase
MRKHMQSIRLRLTLFFVVVTSITLGGFGLFSRNQLSHDLEQQFAGLQQGVVQRLQINLPAPLWSFEVAQMEHIISSEMTPAEVRAIFVQDSRSYNLVGVIKNAQGKLERSLSQDGLSGEPVKSAIHNTAATANAEDGVPRKPEGHAIVYFSRDPIEQALRANMRNLVLQIFLVNLVLLVFLTLGLRMVFRPLKRLRDAQFALAHQKAEEMKALAPIHLTELDELTQGFNETMSKLKHVIEMRITAEKSAVAATQETRQVLERLITAQEELVKAGKLAALGRLVGGIAHELNTPIGNGLMAASTLIDQLKYLKAEMADKGPRRSSLENFLHSVEDGMDITLNSLNRSAKLVSNFKQIALDKGSAHPEHFDLNALIGHSVSLVTPALKDANLRIEHAIGERLAIDSDPELLSQVITILVSNAVVHGFDGRDGGVIHVFAETVEKGERLNVLIHIKDNGVGIAVEHLPKIFDPFFTTRLGQGGSGLGLYIANNIVTEILDGRLSVISQVGVGSEFCIDLPLSKLATAPA